MLFRAAVLSVGISLAAVQSAQATIILTATVNGIIICASDNNVGCVFGLVLTDTDATPGRLAIARDGVIVGNVLITGALSIATLAPPVNTLGTSSLSIRNTTQLPATITLAISATGFQGPTTQMFAAGSGLWQTAEGSEIQLSWYHDPANSQGAENPLDRPGTELTTFDDSAKKDLLEAFATDSHHKAILDAPFSMTLGVDMTLVGGGTLVGLGQAVGSE